MSDVGPKPTKTVKKKLDRPLSPDVQVIDLDTPVQKLLEWDKNGSRFQWDFEKFPELDPDTLAELGQFNREGYLISKGVADKLKKQADEVESGLRRKDGPRIESVPDRLDLNIIGGSAAGRTHITGGRKDTHYCLKREDELEESIDAGYDFVDSSDPVKTPGMTKVGGTRRIARHGQTEMVLMKIPKERYDKHIQAIADISVGQVEKQRDGFHEEARRLKKTHHIEYSDDTKAGKDKVPYRKVD